jgi:hypothetical protein
MSSKSILEACPDTALIDDLCQSFENLSTVQMAFVDDLMKLYEQWLHIDVDNVDLAQCRAELDQLLRTSPDFFGWLNRLGNENLHSDMLKALLDGRTSPVLGPLLLRHFLDRVIQRCSDLSTNHLDSMQRLVKELSSGHPPLITVEREVSFKMDDGSTKDSRRIDIVIQTANTVIAIENKVYSSESTDQTSDSQWYLEQLTRQSKSLDSIGILLSPPGHGPKCPHWARASYKDLWASLILSLNDQQCAHESDEFLFGLSYLKTLETLMPWLSPQ